MAVLIDAGFSAARDRAPGRDRRARRWTRVAAIVLTHEHGDHACGAARLARRLGVPVLTAPGTWGRLGGRMKRRASIAPLGLCAQVRAGAVPGHGVPHQPRRRRAARGGAACARTDPASAWPTISAGRPPAVRYLLRDLTALVLEANHDEVQLRTSAYPPVVQRRIAGSSGHLSNRAAAELLVELHHPGLGVVVLAHLSQQCNTAADARAAVAPALRRVGFAGTLHVAEQDAALPAIPVHPLGQMQLKLAL